ncbi:hypothetical protein NIES4075_71450 [Tolypothrix sp. NIES-4075]|uniref:AlbA family DNA-binding domain-containing protein n=1 Tax=Tolypothrix sp. NIES-4075 TaxID=2005459 RepID=UPI000B5CE467|nr:RNA-binding domain-containing protein [Tolypothrix sp. NIES-4075]GAX46124.1 hypothetical protein NIES4075_71450 [Tolypothrix sp. NIES-4075]
MPKPKEVFDCPENYWEFVTASSDSDFEGQHFDRKEAGRPDQCGNVGNSQIQKVTEQITECISAFANTNLLGGLLVIGISNKGEVKGIKHLTEKKLNNLLNINVILSNQSAQVRLVDCQDDTHSPNIIALIYVPYTKSGICQTIGNSPQAWKRQGFQNILLNYEQLYQLKRDKRILDFEHEFCCSYDPNDLDIGVLQEFRKVYLLDAEYEYSDEQLLYNAGALIKDGNQYAFTNAGFLFFAANPQRLLRSQECPIFIYSFK